ncbi:MAG: mechanosensitive ion channel family protein [Spirochaetaceae bacterium]|nr:mechanosensitive ion channel family protein [Spirochaetaceae bacterium]
MGKSRSVGRSGKSILMTELTAPVFLRTIHAMESFLSASFGGRPVRTLLISAAVLVGGVILALLVRTVLVAILRRDENTPGLRIVRSFVFPASILAALYGALAVIQLEGTALSVTNGVFVVLFSLMTIRFVVTIVDTFFSRSAGGDGVRDLSRLKPLRSLSVLIIWGAGLLFLLDNLGFDITAVVAALGIGGIAVALAAQAILGDLFSYFVILFDRPFEIGDFVVSGDIKGSVEKIGIKTTRLRSPAGEQITVSNSDLTSSSIRNYKRMESRRIVFHIRVVYGTPAEKLRLIPVILEEVVRAEEMAAFDRAHFTSYGEWNLSFEVVYKVITADYAIYMDMQQRMNLAIYERFEAEGIEFAIPAQTVKLDGSDSGASHEVVSS